MLAKAVPSLSPQQSAPLYDHLFEVNPLWALEESPDIDWCEDISFETDIDRIRMHLWMVEKKLSLSASSSAERTQLIQTLAIYREAKQYPQNHYYATRRPYFIDEHGTACAVGHLLQQSGYGKFAQKISQETNDAYLNDMSYPEIGIWADAHGFAVEELALIQPGYPPSTTWTTLGAGANDEVTALYADEGNGRLIVAGKFTELDQVSCSQVGTYQNGTFSALGAGIDGDIHAIAVLGTDIFLGGLFENDNNIAIWDGSQWSYEQILVGEVHAFHVWNGELLAGGDFASTGGSIDRNYLVRRQAGNWEAFGWNSGPVYAFAEHNGQLIAGGMADVNSLDPHYVSYLDLLEGWKPMGAASHRLDNVVHSLLSYREELYAAGGCVDANDSTTFCFARLDTGKWVSYLQYDIYSFPNRAITSLVGTTSHLYLGGDIQINPEVGTYGRGLATLELFDALAYLEAVADLDSGAHAITTFQNKLIVGGAFQNQGRLNPSPLPFLMQADLSTSIEERPQAEFSLYPNPITDQASGEVDSPESITALQLYDLQGRQIALDYDLQGQEFSFRRANIPTGMYFLQIWSENKLISQGKLMMR